MITSTWQNALFPRGPRRPRQRRHTNLKDTRVLLQQKSAITSTQVDAIKVSDVEEPACARRVTDLTGPMSAQKQLVCLLSPLQHEFLYEHLADHPDQEFVTELMNYIDNGVPIGYTGPLESRESPNWPSAWKYADAVQKSIREDVAKGRMMGPFDSPPLPNYVSNPVGAVPKKRSDKVRPINDLSWLHYIRLNW